MAQGKNAYIRYKVLDRCFRDSRRHYYMEDLVEACNEVLYNYDGSSVSERTIREDIHFMQRQAGGGVPLERKMDGHRAYYMYSDRNFSIQNLPMSQSEAEMLSDTIQMLSRFKGLPNQEWLNATLVQMKSTFNIGQAKASYVSFSQNEDLKGLKYFTPLYEAIASQHVVSLEYHQFGRPSYNRIIHPYQLRQYNNRWFLLGKSAEYDTIGNYALDRIVSFKKVDVPFCNNTQINFDTYFDDVIGVTVPKGDIKTVVLRFSENRFPYIVSKPLHQSQEVNLEERTITIKVKPNKELDQLIFSFIPDVEVLSPQSLRDTIKEKIEENLKKYLSAQNTPLNHGTFVQ